MNSRASFGITEKARDVVRAILQHVVAEESQLAAAMRGYVWRVRGSPVQSLVRLFSEQGRQIDRWLGELATQAPSTGAALAAMGEESMAGVAMSDAPVSGRAMIAELLTRHETLASQLREDVDELEYRGDVPAKRVLAGLLEFHETTAWMLRLLLDSPESARLMVR